MSETKQFCLIIRYADGREETNYFIMLEEAMKAAKVLSERDDIEWYSIYEQIPIKEDWKDITL